MTTKRRCLGHDEVRQPFLLVDGTSASLLRFQVKWFVKAYQRPSAIHWVNVADKATPKWAITNKDATKARWNLAHNSQRAGLPTLTKQNNFFENYCLSEIIKD